MARTTKTTNGTNGGRSVFKAHSIKRKANEMDDARAKRVREEAEKLVALLNENGTTKTNVTLTLAGASAKDVATILKGLGDELATVRVIPVKTKDEPSKAKQLVSERLMERGAEGAHEAGLRVFLSASGEKGKGKRIRAIVEGLQESDSRFQYDKATGMCYYRS